jgi:hypothetical protein
MDFSNLVSQIRSLKDNSDETELELEMRPLIDPRGLPRNVQPSYDVKTTQKYFKGLITALDNGHKTKKEYLMRKEYDHDKINVITSKKQHGLIKSKLIKEQYKYAIKPHVVSMSVASEKKTDIFKMRIPVVRRVFRKEYMINVKKYQKWRIDISLVFTSNFNKNNIRVDDADQLFIEVEYIGNTSKISKTQVQYGMDLIIKLHKLAMININKIGGDKKPDYMVELRKLSMLLGRNNQSTLKKLTNQAKTLDKNMYHALNKSDLWLTDKADGERAVVVFGDDGVNYISSEVKRLSNDSFPRYVFDSELINGVPYVFDVMIYANKVTLNLPFSERVKFMHMIEADSKLSKYVKVKPFVKLDKNYSKEIKKIWSDKKNKPYDTDGLIFVDDDKSYYKTNNYKWKPSNTIDFLCMENKPGEYYLFSGITKQLFQALGIQHIKNYTELFKTFTLTPAYFPTHFSMPNYPDSYIFKSTDKTLHKKIVELEWDVEKTKWKLHRVREDRSRDLETKSYYGNFIAMASQMWYLFYNPFTLKTLTSKDTRYFSRVSDKHANIRKFNNFVKLQIMKRFYNKKTVIDLASGKGQDLLKYRIIKASNVMLCEIDKDATAEMISRIYSARQSPHNTRFYVQNMDLNDDWKKNITPIENLSNNTFKQSKVELITCNLAFHYLIGSKKNLANIISFISYFLVKGGYFMFTAFDGQKIFDMLKNKKHIKNETFEIIKKYKESKFADFGQKIDALIPCSETHKTEYLVNDDVVDKELMSRGIKKIDEGSYAEYFTQYNQTLNPNEKEFIELYKYRIFRKV